MHLTALVGRTEIDLKYFRETTVDPSTYVTSISPSARLGNIALDLFNQIGRAMARVSVLSKLCVHQWWIFTETSSVGIWGHIFHEGQGYGSHTYGLLLDFLFEAEPVTADGSVITASENENSDVFWALTSWSRHVLRHRNKFQVLYSCSPTSKCLVLLFL